MKEGGSIAWRHLTLNLKPPHFFTLKPRLQVPFNLSCPMPGKFRWVTTTIARFDPNVDWPTDINCTLDFNKELTTYDGGCARNTVLLHCNAAAVLCAACFLEMHAAIHGDFLFLPP